MHHSLDIPAQRLGQLGLRTQSAAFQDGALGRAFAVECSLVGVETQEAVFDMTLVVAGHESALALAAYHQVLGCQFVDGLAYRALADAVALGQLHLAGNGFLRLPFTGLQAVQHRLLDLLVERAEGGGAGRFSRAGARTRATRFRWGGGG